MKETQKTLNEELNVIKKMMGLSEDIAKYQFAKDLQDDPEYVQFKKDAIYKDDHNQDRAYGVPRADGNDPFVTKGKKWDRVKPDDLTLGDEIDEDDFESPQPEDEPELSTLTKRDRSKFTPEEVWKDRSDMLHLFNQYLSALRSSVSGSLKFLNKMGDQPFTKDAKYSTVLNQTFYEHILSMNEKIDQFVVALSKYKELTDKYAPTDDEQALMLAKQGIKLEE